MVFYRFRPDFIALHISSYHISVHQVHITLTLTRLNSTGLSRVETSSARRSSTTASIAAGSGSYESRRVSTSLDESRRVSTSLLVLDTTLNTANSEVETVGSLMIFDDLCKSDASLMQVWCKSGDAMTMRLQGSWSLDGLNGEFHRRRVHL